jgi:uncharacterized protein
MTTDTERNKQRVTDFFARLGSPKDVAGAMTMMADEGSWTLLGSSDKLPFFGTHSKAAITGMLQQLVPAMKDGLHITPVGLVAEGNRVAMESTSYGELPTGRVYQNRCHFLVELREDGKILHIREYLDPQALVSAVAP